MDEAFPTVEPFDLCSIDIESDDRHAFATKLEAQGKPNVSETNNCYRIFHDQFFLFRTLKERFRGPRLRHGRWHRLDLLEKQARGFRQKTMSPQPIGSGLRALPRSGEEVYTSKRNLEEKKRILNPQGFLSNRFHSRTAGHRAWVLPPFGLLATAISRIELT